ncbi:MAG: ROK family protein [Actinomycetota bacterium]
MTLPVLVIDVGATWIKSARVDSDGVIRKLRKRPTRYPCSPASLLTSLELIMAAGEDWGDLAVGFPGDLVEGVVVDAANLTRAAGPGSPVDSELRELWTSFPLARALREKCTGRVVVSNDAEMAARGCALGTGVEVTITLGSGCGVALVIEGQVTPIDDVGGTLFDEQRTFDEAVGERARRQDETSWHSDVVVAIARIAQRWPQAAVHLCGGNAKRLSPTQLKETSSTITIERGEPALKGGFMMLTGLSA